MLCCPVWCYVVRCGATYAVRGDVNYVVLCGVTYVLRCDVTYVVRCGHVLLDVRRDVARCGAWTH